MTLRTRLERLEASVRPRELPPMPPPIDRPPSESREAWIARRQGGMQWVRAGTVWTQVAASKRRLPCLATL